MKNMYKKIIIILFILLSQNAFADKVLHDANQCLMHLDHFEKKHNIPKNLLKSISLVETGIYHKETKKIVPWPWTINVEGQGFYYSSKQEALQAVQKFIRTGKKSIDVGCMQINLKNHPKAFSNLHQAFDPKFNVEYAASFLKNHFAKDYNWKNAVASYHSKTQHLGSAYAEKVINKWKNDKTDFASNKYKVDKVSYKNGKAYMKNPSHSKLSERRRKSNMMIKVSTNNRYKAPEENTDKMNELTKEILNNYNDPSNDKPKS